MGLCSIHRTGVISITIVRFSKLQLNTVAHWHLSNIINSCISLTFVRQKWEWSNRTQPWKWIASNQDQEMHCPARFGRQTDLREMHCKLALKCNFTVICWHQTWGGVYLIAVPAKFLYFFFPLFVTIVLLPTLIEVVNNYFFCLKGRWNVAKLATLHPLWQEGEDP